MTFEEFCAGIRTQCQKNPAVMPLVLRFLRFKKYYTIRDIPEASREAFVKRINLVRFGQSNQ
jgi:hypothetical protein